MSAQQIAANHVLFERSTHFLGHPFLPRGQHDRVSNLRAFTRVKSRTGLQRRGAFSTKYTKAERVHALKGLTLTLPRASHSGTLAAVPVLLAHAVVTVAKNK